MTPTLDQFEKWLARRGRSERTREQYVRVMTGTFLKCSDPLQPILNRKHSSCYRRHLALVLKSWAKFSKDVALTEQIEELTLPAPVRKKARTPLSRDEWFQVIDAIDACEFRPALKAVMGLIVVRGLRCSDALRIERADVENAAKTGVLSFVAKGDRRIEFSTGPIEKYLNALLELDAWPRNKPVWYLVTRRGARTCQSAAKRVRRAIKELARTAGVDESELYAHRMRHTYVNAFLAELEGDPRAVFLLQDQMGWANLNTARNYVARGTRAELDRFEEKLFARKR